MYRNLINQIRFYLLLAFYDRKDIAIRKVSHRAKIYDVYSLGM